MCNRWIRRRTRSKRTVVFQRLVQNRRSWFPGQGWLSVHYGKTKRNNQSGRRKDITTGSRPDLHGPRRGRAGLTFPVPNEVLGEELATAVLLRPQSAVTADQLREFVSQKLADFKVPRQILIVSEIPKGAFGKIQRHLLAKQ